MLETGHLQLSSVTENKYSILQNLSVCLSTAACLLRPANQAQEIWLQAVFYILYCGLLVTMLGLNRTSASEGHPFSA